MPDPSDPQSLNRYSYVLNNPLALVDPSGHAPNMACNGVMIADCGVDGWLGIEHYLVLKQLTGEWEENAQKVTAIAKTAVNIALGFIEPIDYAMTIGGCLQGDCNVVGLGLMVLPFASGSMARTADDVAEIANKLDTDLYAFGSRSGGPRLPRVDKDVFPDTNGLLSPQSLPFPEGASTYSNINSAPLSGHYHRLPVGTELPDGFGVAADGLDVNIASPHPQTHHTIFNTKQMPLDQFTDLFSQLPWQYGGRK